jgi:catechol 2,3-dioxygenase-like lactoylglutathione lyase family enzyme
MMEINSITVALPVTDLNRAIAWYRKLLGELEEISPAEGIVEMRLMPSFWLQLFQLESNESSSKSLNLETENIALSHEIVLSLGADAGQIETVPETIRYFEFSDPFGNLLSFYQHLVSDA